MIIQSQQEEAIQSKYHGVKNARILIIYLIVKGLCKELGE
jgi:hypothetical protein